MLNNMKCLLSPEQRSALANIIFKRADVIAESNKSIDLDNFIKELYNFLLKNGLAEDTALDAARISISYLNAYQGALSTKKPSLHDSFISKDQFINLYDKVKAFNSSDSGLDAVRSVLGLNVNLAEKANTLQQQINNTKKDEESISQMNLKTGVSQ